MDLKSEADAIAGERWKTVFLPSDAEIDGFAKQLLEMWWARSKEDKEKRHLMEDKKKEDSVRRSCRKRKQV